MGAGDCRAGWCWRGSRQGGGPGGRLLASQRETGLVRSRGGYTLFEVVVALGLVSVCIPLFFNLVPLSLKALRDSERLRICSSIAQGYLEECYFGSLVPGVDVATSLTVNGEAYQVRREIYALDASRLDVVVVVWWANQPERPFRLAGRVASGSF